MISRTFCVFRLFLHSQSLHFYKQSLDRLYGKVIEGKLVQYIMRNIGQDQTEFTADKSSIDQIYILRQLLG